MHILRMIGFLLASVVLVVPALTQEKKINRSDLPAAVEKTVSSLSRGAALRGFSQETERGQTLYEAQFTVKGHSKDVLMDSNGNVVEVEEQVDLVSLPPVVKDALQAKAGKGTLVKVESIRKHEKLVAYEAQVITSGRRSEVQVGPKGQTLDHEE